MEEEIIGTFSFTSWASSFFRKMQYATGIKGFESINRWNSVDRSENPSVARNVSVPTFAQGPVREPQRFKNHMNSCDIQDNKSLYFYSFFYLMRVSMSNRMHVHR